MFEWSEEQLMIRDAVRQFVETEIVPHREELEHGDLPPYDILRKLFATFGMDAMARDRFERADRAREGGRAPARRQPSADGERDGRRRQRRRHDDDPDHRALPLLPRAWSRPWACRWASPRPRS